MGMYIDIIRQSFALFPVAALLFTIPYVLHNYHKFGSILSLRILIVYSFILYLMTVYFLVILPLPSQESVAAMTSASIQPVPFCFVGDILREYRKTGVNPLVSRALLQFLFNIAMLMPFGMYQRYYFGCSLRRTAFRSFLLSLFFELTQLTGLYFIYARPYRLFDADDLMANTLGGVLGFLVIGPFLRFLPTRIQIDAYNIRMSKNISFLRRAAAFCTDVGILAAGCVLASLRLTAVRDDLFNTFMGAMIVYFLAVPFITGGCTIGTCVVRIRVHGSRLAVLFRYALMYLLYFRLPFRIVDAAHYIANTFVESEFKLYVYALGALIFGLFVLTEFILALFGRKILAERLSGTVFFSTLHA